MRDRAGGVYFMLPQVAQIYKASDVDKLTVSTEDWWIWASTGAVG